MSSRSERAEKLPLHSIAMMNGKVLDFSSHFPLSSTKVPTDLYAGLGGSNSDPAIASYLSKIKLSQSSDKAVIRKRKPSFQEKPQIRKYVHGSCGLNTWQLINYLIAAVSSTMWSLHSAQVAAHTGFNRIMSVNKSYWKGIGDKLKARQDLDTTQLAWYSDFRATLGVCLEKNWTTYLRRIEEHVGRKLYNYTKKELTEPGSSSSSSSTS